MAERLMQSSKSKELISEGKTILVLGASGLVGSKFVEMYTGKFLVPSHDELDLTDPVALKEFIHNHRPDVIVNFAADTNVNRSQDEKDLPDNDRQSYKLNVLAVETLLDAIADTDTFYIHFSTDMIFDGRNGPYKETDKPVLDKDRLTAYGYDKAKAEQIIEEKRKDESAVVRIIYPVRDFFAKKMDYLHGPLKKFQQGELKPLFSDQQMNITYVEDVCRAVKQIIEQRLSGIFHIASPELTTPHEVVSKYLRKIFGDKVELPAREMGDLAGRYPPKGGLDCQATEERLGMKFKTTDEIVEDLALFFGQ